MPSTELLQAYLDDIQRLRAAIDGMTHAQLVARPVPGKWSTLECLAHIADFEAVFGDRMKRVIAHERPILFVADEDLFAKTLFYQDRDATVELSVVDSCRRQMGGILQRLAPEAFGRIGIHSFKGVVTLEAILGTAVGHLNHHLKFILEKRQALGLA